MKGKPGDFLTKNDAGWDEEFGKSLFVDSLFFVPLKLNPRRLQKFDRLGRIGVISVKITDG
jgi:hypothetical protein